MNTLRLLFSGFLRIWCILPERLSRSTIGLFVAMIFLGLLELGGIMSLSLFAGVLNAPEQVQQSRYAAKLLEFAPFLTPFFADVRAMMLLAVLVPIIMNTPWPMRGEGSYEETEIRAP